MTDLSWLTGNALLFGGVGFLLTIALIFLEVPVAVAMGLVALAGCWAVLGVDGTISIGATTTWDSLTNYTMSVLPLFVLMGNLASHSGLSSRLYGAMRTMLGHRKGGLALATIGASAGFGMISGSSLATTATMGRIALPEMENAGYSRSLAAGTVASGGTLGILIPPSTILVIYAFLSGESIKNLLLATLGPIVLAISLYCLAVYIPLALGITKAPHQARSTRAQYRRALADLLPPVVVFAVIMGGLYLGVFTANETAAIGVALVLVYGIASRRLSMKGFLSAAIETSLTCGAIYLVLIAANLFNYFLTLSGLPFTFTAMFGPMLENPLLVILTMTAIYLVLGTLMDSLAMLLLTVPLFLPVVQAAGIDPIWFGIYAVMVVEIGLITPPVGMNLFVLKATHPSIRMIELWRGVLPFVLADLIRIFIIIALPAIVVWLPHNTF
ncbi:TRAP transporter large permease [Allorhizobium borbori]|uniref:TRAP transporter large permease protein n=1 Tax=Allorhizobium borbori TaxID=485907 RepID=A0A7W6K5N7_9HYPH|nr:TRAP transporter large permease [Allorhizobium borbori]MBB4104477.1 tripartite ATP-independent transporter DctM subunit [Allorhizobium borbori]